MGPLMLLLFKTKTYVYILYKYICDVYHMECIKMISFRLHNFQTEKNNEFNPPSNEKISLLCTVLRETENMTKEKTKCISTNQPAS